MGLTSSLRHHNFHILLQLLSIFQRMLGGSGRGGEGRWHSIVGLCQQCICSDLTPSLNGRLGNRLVQIPNIRQGDIEFSHGFPLLRAIERKQYAFFVLKKSFFSLPEKIASEVVRSIFKKWTEIKTACPSFPRNLSRNRSFALGPSLYAVLGKIERAFLLRSGHSLAAALTAPALLSIQKKCLLSSQNNDKTASPYQAGSPSESDLAGSLLFFKQTFTQKRDLPSDSELINVDRPLPTATNEPGMNSSAPYQILINSVHLDVDRPLQIGISEPRAGNSMTDSVASGLKPMSYASCHSISAVANDSFVGADISKIIIFPTIPFLSFLIVQSTGFRRKKDGSKEKNKKKRDKNAQSREYLSQPRQM
jgi:hypothetical protein